MRGKGWRLVCADGAVAGIYFADCEPIARLDGEEADEILAAGDRVEHGCSAWLRERHPAAGLGSFLCGGGPHKVGRDL